MNWSVTASVEDAQFGTFIVCVWPPSRGFRTTDTVAFGGPPAGMNRSTPARKLIELNGSMGTPRWVTPSAPLSKMKVAFTKCSIGCVAGLITFVPFTSSTSFSRALIAPELLVPEDYEVGLPVAGVREGGYGPAGRLGLQPDEVVASQEGLVVEVVRRLVRAQQGKLVVLSADGPERPP